MSDAGAEKAVSSKRGPTQTEIAEHLDMTDRSVRDIAKKLGIVTQECTLSEFRIAYIRHMRGVASGHQSSDGKSLTDVRLKEAEGNSILTWMTVGERSKTLVLFEDVEAALSELSGGLSDQVMSAGDRIVEAVESRYNIEIDENLINEPLRAALGSIRTSASELVESISGVSDKTSS